MGGRKKKMCLKCPAGLTRSLAWEIGDHQQCDLSINIPSDKPMGCSVSLHMGLGSTEGSVLIAPSFPSKGNNPSQEKKKTKMEKQKTCPIPFLSSGPAHNVSVLASLLKIRGVC